MPLAMDEEKYAVRFLLGELTEAEHSEYENRLADDDELFELVLAIEAELIDEYVVGGLSTQQRDGIQRNLLGTTGGRERLQFAQTLASRRLEPVGATMTSTWAGRVLQWIGAHRVSAAAACAAVAITIAGGWWMTADRRRVITAPEQTRVLQPASQPETQPPEPSQASAELGTTGSSQERNSPTQPPVKESKAATPRQSDVVAFAFPLQTTRGVGELRTLRVPSSTRTVRLILDLPPDRIERYSVALKTADGHTVLSIAGLPPTHVSRRQLRVDLPTQKLVSEEYVLSVFGDGQTDVTADFIFRIQFD